MTNIHPTAIIETGAKLAPDVQVGPYAFIGANVSIGRGTTIGHGAHIEGHTTVGSDNRIFSYAVLGSAPQDLKYAGEPTRLEIGDRNTFREFCQINSGTEGGGGVTRIGNDCLFMGHTHAAHDVIMGNRCIIANFTGIAGHVVMGDYVTIGAESGIHQFVHIGSYTMIGGASAVTQDIPPFSLAEGNRAVVRGLNLVGLRRHLERDRIDALKPVYKALFRSGRNPKSAAQELLDGELTPEARMLCEFVIASKRGIPLAQDSKEEGAQ
ncbi:MAG: acyl-ACP--UDP-N-acetylglucosamine O-acyltransferase [Campylobacterales bacterium]